MCFWMFLAMSGETLEARSGTCGDVSLFVIRGYSGKKAIAEASSSWFFAKFCSG